MLTLAASSNRNCLVNENIGTINDIVCCPGADFCALANTASLDVPENLLSRFEERDRLYGERGVKINISGWMSVCGHHHAGSMGLPGVSENAADWYQVTLGRFCLIDSEDRDLALNAFTDISKSYQA